MSSFGSLYNITEGVCYDGRVTVLQYNFSRGYTHGHIIPGETWKILFFTLVPLRLLRVPRKNNALTPTAIYIFMITRDDAVYTVLYALRKLRDPILLFSPRPLKPCLSLTKFKSHFLLCVKPSVHQQLRILAQCAPHDLYFQKQFNS